MVKLELLNNDLGDIPDTKPAEKIQFNQTDHIPTVVNKSCHSNTGPDQLQTLRQISIISTPNLI